MNHTCLDEFLFGVLFSSSSSLSFFLLVLDLSTIFVNIYFNLLSREDMLKKTEPTKENFTRPILPLSTFCVLHQFNVEKKRGKTTEKERKMAQDSFSSASTQFMTVAFLSSLISFKVKTYEDKVLLLTEFELNLIKNSKHKNKK